MIVCPQCGSPLEGDFRVISERAVSCNFCDWAGSSTDLVDVEPDQAKDPKVFELLADWVRDTMGAPLMTGLYINGLVPSKVQVAGEESDQLVIAQYMTKVIRTYVAGIMEGVMNPNVLESKGRAVEDGMFLHWFAKNVEKDFIRGMIHLGVVKKDKNPANIRYITKLVRHGARKMWSTLVEELRDGEKGKN